MLEAPQDFRLGAGLEGSMAVQCRGENEEIRGRRECLCVSGSGNVRFFSFCFWAIVLPPILLSVFSANSIFFF